MCPARRIAVRPRGERRAGCRPRAAGGGVDQLVDERRAGRFPAAVRMPNSRLSGTCQRADRLLDHPHAQRPGLAHDVARAVGDRQAQSTGGAPCGSRSSSWSGTLGRSVSVRGLAGRRARADDAAAAVVAAGDRQPRVAGLRARHAHAQREAPVRVGAHPRREAPLTTGAAVLTARAQSSSRGRRARPRSSDTWLPSGERPRGPGSAGDRRQPLRCSPRAAGLPERGEHLLARRLSAMPQTATARPPGATAAKVIPV